MEKTNKWVIDPTHSEVSFKVKHMMISTVTGHFEQFEATIDTENDNFENASLSVEIGIDSINTKNKDRDAHLKSEDFFKTDEYPKMVFTSKSFTTDKIIGDLT